MEGATFSDHANRGSHRQAENRGRAHLEPSEGESREVGGEHECEYAGGAVGRGGREVYGEFILLFLFYRGRVLMVSFCVCCVGIIAVLDMQEQYADDGDYEMST